MTFHNASGGLRGLRRRIPSPADRCPDGKCVICQYNEPINSGRIICQTCENVLHAQVRVGLSFEDTLAVLRRHWTDEQLNAEEIRWERTG